MSSEFLTSETELQFFFDDPFLSFAGSDSTLDDILCAISPDIRSPANGLGPQLESLSLGQANPLQPHLTNATSFSLSDGFLQNFAGSDSTLDDILGAISPDTRSPANGLSPQLESLSLGQANPLQPHLTNATSFSLSDGFLQNFAGGYDQFPPHSYSEESLSSRFSCTLQRSHSSGCFSEKPRPVMVQGALLDGFPNSPDFQRQDTGCSSPESSLFDWKIRRGFSTGDLQSPVAAADGGSLVDEASFRVARYSPEQRKERILKYKAKRTRRNFNKTIKYACRKTLADSRPRIRGRFARNDETGDVPKAASAPTTDDDDDEFWVGMLENGQRSHSRRSDIHGRLWPRWFPIL